MQRGAQTNTAQPSMQKANYNYNQSRQDWNNVANADSMNGTMHDDSTFHSVPKTDETARRAGGSPSTTNVRPGTTDDKMNSTNPATSSKW